MIDSEIVQKMQQEFYEKFSDCKYVRFHVNGKVTMDDYFNLEELKFIVHLMEKYGVHE